MKKINFQTGSPYVVFAWGDEDPYSTSNTIFDLTNQGRKQIILLNNPSANPDTKSIAEEHVEFSIKNVSLPV